MPRFVVLEHDHPVLHWDWMLEAGPLLRTWRLEGAPVLGQRIRAEPLADHRLAYLDYEGPVSGNRGTVTRWDGGTFEWISDERTCLCVRVRGTRLHGMAELRQDVAGGWEFVCE